MADLKQTMQLVSELNESHGVRQKGSKKYPMVVHRMEAFRQVHGRGEQRTGKRQQDKCLRKL